MSESQKREFCQAISNKTKERCKNLINSTSIYCSKHNKCNSNIIDKEDIPRSKTNIFRIDYPELYDEIDFENIENPKKDLIEYYDNENSKMLVWKCKKAKCNHHIYKAKIKYRINKGHGCPFCSHHQVCICESIITTNPEIAKQFITEDDLETYKDQTYKFKIYSANVDGKKQWNIINFNIRDIVNHNKKFDLEKIRIGSNPVPKIGEIKGVFWKCTNTDISCKHHVWDANFVDRKNSDGCPFCSTPKQRICECFNVVSQKYFSEFDTLNPNNPSIEYLETISKNSSLKLWWKCNDCNNSWETSCINRTHGQICIHCDSIISKMNKKANISNKFDYSLFVYKGPTIKSTIICKEHNIIYEDCYYNHINGRGCPKCTKDKYNLRQSKYKQIFIDKCNVLFQNSYDYSEFIYINTLTEGKIICKICNNFFYKTPEHHKNRKEGCPICKKSHGEFNITNILKEMKLNYILEYKISDIPEISLKRFDFFIEYNDMKVLIEFDGRQHFIFIPNIFHKDYGDFVNRQKIDVLKTILPLKYNYCIIRISYLEFNTIREHIKLGLKKLTDGYKYYFSNMNLYKSIIEEINGI